MIDINARKAHPLSPGFSGFNNADLEFAVSFRDPRYQRLAASLEPGWHRFSGGAVSNVYDWQAGDVPTEWVNQFTGNNRSCFQREQKLVRGRGGVRFDDYLQFAAATGARTMICFNASLTRRTYSPAGSPVGQTTSTRCALTLKRSERSFPVR
jgi:hypothetical protein